MMSSITVDGSLFIWPDDRVSCWGQFASEAFFTLATFGVLRETLRSGGGRSPATFGVTLKALRSGGEPATSLIPSNTHREMGIENPRN